MPGFVSRKPGVQLSEYNSASLPTTACSCQGGKRGMPCRQSEFESQLDTKSVDYLIKPLTCSRKPLVSRLSGRDEGSIIPTTPNCCVLLYFTLSPYWIDLLHSRSMFNLTPNCSIFL